jgi:hypothetical protein
MSGIALAEKEKTYDVRGMSFRERLALMGKIQQENKQKNMKTPQQKAEAFFVELKTSGSVALDNLKEGSMLNSSTSKFVDQEMQKDMSKDEGLSKIDFAMKEEDGNIKKYRKVGNDEQLLNGNYYRTRYLIEYENGKTQTVEMLFIKPTISGEHVLTEINVN